MRLTEIEPKCEEIGTLREKVRTKKIELQELELQAEKKKENFQALKIMARVAGEKYEGEYEPSEVEKVQVEIQKAQQNIEQLEKEVLTEMKELTLPIRPEVPVVGPDTRSTINFDGNPCNSSVRFIASILDSDIPLKLDNVELYPDKVIVTGVKTSIQVANALQILCDNIHRLARIALEESDSDIEEIVKYFYESLHRDIWEAIKGKARVTNQELYSILSLDTDKDRKKIRNFFSNTENTLKEKYPFRRLSGGIYELTFFGRLVWKKYQDKYLRKEGMMKQRKEKEGIHIETEKKTEERTGTQKLNDYFNEDKIRKTIYGKKVD